MKTDILENQLNLYKAELDQVVRERDELEALLQLFIPPKRTDMSYSEREEIALAAIAKRKGKP